MAKPSPLPSLRNFLRSRAWSSSEDFLEGLKYSQRGRMGSGRGDGSFRGAGDGTFSQRYKVEAGRGPMLRGGKVRSLCNSREEGDAMRLDG